MDRMFAYCIDCNKEINFKAKRCKSCSNRNRKGKEHYNQGINHPSYIDNRTNKKHYCIDCRKNITYFSAIYGLGRCGSCEIKRRHKLGIIKNEISTEKRAKMMKGYKYSPNKAEQYLNNLLKICLKQKYKFVGDGKVIIDRFNPDFININGQKKIIELYGDYWHNKKDSIPRDKRRIETYSKYGYKTLVIWEHELNEPEQILAKVMEFNHEQSF